MSDINPADRLSALERRRDQLEQRRVKIVHEMGEVEADISALRRVVDRCLLSAEAEDGAESDGRKGEVKEAVLAVLSLAVSPFNATAIVNLIKEMTPGSEIDAGPVSTCLRRLVDEGRIVEQEKGQGRRQTTYRHKDSSGEVAA